MPRTRQREAHAAFPVRLVPEPATAHIETDFLAFGDEPVHGVAESVHDPAGDGREQTIGHLLFRQAHVVVDTGSRPAGIQPTERIPSQFRSRPRRRCRRSRRSALSPVSDQEP